MSDTNRVATPKTGNDVVKGLSDAIGARIEITTSSTPPQTYNGLLYSACNNFNVVAINTSLSSPSQVTNSKPILDEVGDYSLVAISSILSFRIISLPDPGVGSSVFPPVTHVDTISLKQREASRVRQLQEEEKDQGRGVTEEAQALFGAIKRLITNTRWDGQDIVVDNDVRIKAPYKAENCSAKDDKRHRLPHIQKIVEGEQRKIADRARANSPLPLKGG